MKKIFCVDPGTSKSGVCLLNDGEIVFGDTIVNNSVFLEIEKLKGEGLEVIIEDITPYSVQMGQDVIDTCKYIGELCYCLKLAGIKFEVFPRWHIKEWVFDYYNDVVLPEIIQRIKTRKLKYKNGEYRKASFVYVNDRGVLNAMKKRWGIEKPKPGKKSPLGLNGHSWQALALGTYHIDNPIKKIRKSKTAAPAQE